MPFVQDVDALSLPHGLLGKAVEVQQRCAGACWHEHARNRHVQVAGLGGAADTRSDHGRPSAAVQRQRPRNGIIGLGSPDRRNGRLLRTHSVRPCSLRISVGDTMSEKFCRI